MKVPACIGIILDGNRRWAKAHDLPVADGHRRGYDNLTTIAKAVRDRGAKHLVVYAFSTENWQRSPEEVEALMALFRLAFSGSSDEFKAERIRVRFIGERERFDVQMQENMRKTEEETAQGDQLTLWVGLSYGSRAEIVAAARSLSEQGADVTETSLRAAMWSAEMPDPDLIIRPGGEQRLSNFLLWQAAYSELCFVPELWPDFTAEVLDRCLADFAERERRRGK